MAGLATTVSLALVAMAGPTSVGATPVARAAAATACGTPNAVFGLGRAAPFTILGLDNGSVTISQGDTKVTGDVGVGPTNGGALLKATIDGKLWLDPTATPDIHPDLVVTGGTATSDLSGAVADARAASALLSAKPPTRASLGNITTSTTITVGPGLNVIPVSSVDLVKRTLTISGPSSAIVLFKVDGEFNFSSSQTYLTGGIGVGNILWNFSTTGSGDIDIFKDVTTAIGIFLAPNRNILIDHTVTTGQLIGQTVTAHSAATVTCGPDTTPPQCVLSATIPGPPKAIQVTVQDPESGITAITEQHTNATVSYAPNPPNGTTAPIVVTATKVNQAQSSFLRLTVTNGVGVTTICDPVVPAAAHRPAKTRAHVPTSRRAVSLGANRKSVAFGDAAGVTLSGRVRGARAGQQVTVFAHTCGFTAASAVATVKTGAGGAFHFRVQPAINTTFSVRSPTAASSPVSVAVQPALTLARVGGRRYSVDVTTTNGAFLDGRRVFLQRASGSRWKTVARTTLSRNSPIDQITAVSSATLNAPKGTGTMRAVLPRSQAPCYAAATSAPLAG